MNVSSIFNRASLGAALLSLLFFGACDDRTRTDLVDSTARSTSELDSAVDRANAEKTRRVETLLALDDAATDARRKYDAALEVVPESERDAISKEIENGSLSPENEIRPEIAAALERWKELRGVEKERTANRAEFDRLETALVRAEKLREKLRQKREDDARNADSSPSAADELEAFVAAADDAVSEFELSPDDVLVPGPDETAKNAFETAPLDDATRIQVASRKLTAAANKLPTFDSGWFDALSALESVSEIKPPDELRAENPEFAAAVERLEKIADETRRKGGASAEPASRFQKIVDPQKIEREEEAKESEKAEQKRAERRQTTVRVSLGAYFVFAAFVVGGVVLLLTTFFSRPQAAWADVPNGTSPSTSPESAPASDRNPDATNADPRKIVACALVFALSFLVFGPCLGIFIGPALAYWTALALDCGQVAASIRRFANRAFSVGGVALVLLFAFGAILTTLGIGAALYFGLFDGNVPTFLAF